MKIIKRRNNDRANHYFIQSRLSKDKSKDLPIIIVPARLASLRFPRKLLQEVNGTPLLIHTANRLIEVAPEFDLVFAVDGKELTMDMAKSVLLKYDSKAGITIILYGR